MKCAAVIAAAGLSSRMREFKPMMCLDDQTMIEMVIRNFQQAGVSEIVVVAGYRAELLKKHLRPLGVTVCENSRFAQTKMYDSLKAGLKRVSSDCQSVFLTPGDIPMVTPETLRAMQSAEADIVRPQFGESLGHPVLVKSRLISSLLSYSGEQGLRGAVEKLDGTVLDLPVDDEGVLMDADTPEDFRELRRLSRKLRSRGKLYPEVHLSIVKAEEILTPENAQLLEMIDHTGSIQSACACIHVSYSSGWRRLNEMEEELGYPLVDRQPGGSNGGGTALTAKGRMLLNAYRAYCARLLETSRVLFEEFFPEELRE